MSIWKKEKESMEQKMNREKQLREEELVETQFREIQKIDPAVKNMAALLKAVDAEQFRKYVFQGLSFVDAYWLCSREKLMKRLCGAGPDTKSHLRAAAPQGRGQAGVPPEELRLYRELLPELNDAEFRRHYNADTCRVED